MQQAQSVQVYCAKVPIRKGEFYRKKFSEKNLIDKRLAIKHNNSYLFIPLSIKPNSVNISSPELKWVNDANIELMEKTFEFYPRRINNYKSLLEFSISKELFHELPTSYDVIGAIAIIKIPVNLFAHSKEIGEAIIKVHKNIRTVLSDSGIQGETRVRKLEYIAGENNTITEHKEYGVRFKLDVSKVYFSPRLGKEHYRIANLVKSGETVLDMFAGIGPFSIMIAKYSMAKQIYAIDINRFAIKYLIKNIDLNKIKNIFPLESDVREVLEKVPFANRIIMNLPMESERFLDCALQKINTKGKIHLHKIYPEENINKFINKLEIICKRSGFSINNADLINLNSYSAKLNHYCIDLDVRKGCNKSDK